MFGLSEREHLAKIVKDSIESQLPVYRIGVQEVLSKETIEERNDARNEAQLEDEMSQVRMDYLQSVFDNVKSVAEAKYGYTAIQFDAAFQYLQTSGLPEELDTRYFAKNGVSAGIVYLLLLRVVSRKPIPGRDYRRSFALSYDQTRFMNKTLAHIAEEEESV